MKITGITTIQQYQEWLNTNPSFTEIKAACAEVCKQVGKACKRMLGKLQRNRSCLAPMACKTTFPLYFNILRTNGFQYWMTITIPERREATTKRIKALMLNESMLEDQWAMFHHNYPKQTMLERIEQEIAMEQLHYEALKTLAHRN